MLELDGSYGEGGGQIVRTALFLSTILKTPVKISNIRAKRKKPGLKRQHLHIVKLLRELASAEVEGDSLGSEELTYIPGELKPGSYRVNFGSAGSISLFLQTILPVSLFVPGKVEVEVTGGTEVPMSPTIDWVRFVYLPHVSGIAEFARLDVVRRGYYPAGGGCVKLTAEGGLSEEPKDLKSVREFLKGRIDLFKNRRGDIKRLHLLSVAEERLRERKVVERQVSGAIEFLKEKGFPEPEVYRQYVKSPSIGTSVTLWLEDTEGNLFGADNLGKKGKPAEVVGEECARKLWEDWSSGATVDRHLADHLVPWIGLTGGSIKVPLFTGHLETNIWVCERFLGEGTFRVSREERVVEAVV
ncbi:RNA 3'-terminal phosphate cyclase [Hydrogenivirga sp. 128-5-R1-1]|uniref:RNA 3'-terminal phosphate cyclase n=1 Tax=Hydrogenivirga sp. 128-5-R1-1 TaxID=392423 RepID=UPI00015EF97A|nr:RNA 3'-terminal phosphate cyclase [Hydrogenivirga sp. 128-5-R1-1]EDP75240.1 RNA 3'-terminal-phosphate cyclase [Hydrogenivirga sp. 128-5-R1-1]